MSLLDITMNCLKSNIEIAIVYQGIKEYISFISQDNITLDEAIEVMIQAIGEEDLDVDKMRSYKLSKKRQHDDTEIEERSNKIPKLEEDEINFTDYVFDTNSNINLLNSISNSSNFGVITKKESSMIDKIDIIQEKKPNSVFSHKYIETSKYSRPPYKVGLIRSSIQGKRIITDSIPIITVEQAKLMLDSIQRNKDNPETMNISD